MSLMQSELQQTKARYREIFYEATQNLNSQFMLLLTESHYVPVVESTASCTPFSSPGDKEPHSLAAVKDVLSIPMDSTEACKTWLNACIFHLENNVAKKILNTMNRMNLQRAQTSCGKCGMCCRLASSEFSWQELTVKANQGDAFAQQFTSIFLPFASTESALERFPQQVTDVLSNVPCSKEGDTEVYFYHCPYVTQDNLCGLYGSDKRPAICETYPETPLTFIYKQCAWKPWQESTHEDALRAYAYIELCTFYAAQLKERLISLT